MELLLVSGMSGAGKSLAADVLEDLGYYCAENIPPRLIENFVALANEDPNGPERMALITDIRSNSFLREIESVVAALRENGQPMKLLFLEASDEILIRRYKEHRRKHPLCDANGYTLMEAVANERAALSALRTVADYRIDTGNLTTAQFKSRLCELVLGSQNGALQVQCRSFGFKYGMDHEADLVYDVRCLPNPFYVAELKQKTGKDAEIENFVFGFPQSLEFEKRMTDFLDYALPLYVQEGKSQLVISMGCTGGKHRSVLFAERVAKHLAGQGYHVTTLHRDIEK